MKACQACSQSGSGRYLFLLVTMLFVISFSASAQEPKTTGETGGEGYSINEDGYIQFTEEHIKYLMSLGTEGIMEKAYKEGAVKEIVDFNEVYGNKAYVFYYNSTKEADVQKRLAIVTYGLSRDKRLKGIKICGCDVSKQKGFKVNSDGSIFPGKEVYNHLSSLPEASIPASSIFDAYQNTPLNAELVGPGNNESISNFLRVIPNWILSNLKGPLESKSGLYIMKFNREGTKIEVFYIR